LHAERDVTREDYSYEKILEENVKVSLDRAKMVQGTEDHLVYMNVFKTERLPVFSKLVN